MTESTAASEKKLVHGRGIRWSLVVLFSAVVLTAVSIVVVVAMFGDGFNAVVPAMIVFFIGGAVAVVLGGDCGGLLDSPASGATSHPHITAPTGG